MKGILYKVNDMWVVEYPKYPTSSKIFELTSLPLHPDDVKEIENDSKIFDNIEARIAHYPNVEFEIVTVDKQDQYDDGKWARSYSEVKYAKLK